MARRDENLTRCGFPDFPVLAPRRLGAGTRIHYPVGSISVSAEDLPWYLWRVPTPTRVFRQTPKVEVDSGIKKMCVGQNLEVTERKVKSLPGP